MKAIIRTIDKILTASALILLFYIIAGLLFEPGIMAVLIAVAFYSFLSITIRRLPVRRKSVPALTDKYRIYYAVRKFPPYHFLPLFKAEYNPRVRSRYIEMDVSGEKILVLPLIQINPVTAEYIIATCRRAKKLGADKLYLLGAEPDRAFNKIKNALPVSFEIIPLTAVTPMLHTINPLAKAEAVKPVFRFKLKKMPPLLWGGISMLLLSFIVPYKIYYILFGGFTIFLYLISSFNKEIKTSIINDDIMHKT